MLPDITQSGLPGAPHLTDPLVPGQCGGPRPGGAARGSQVSGGPGSLTRTRGLPPHKSLSATSASARPRPGLENPKSQPF